MKLKQLSKPSSTSFSTLSTFSTFVKSTLGIGNSPFVRHGKLRRRMSVKSVGSEVLKVDNPFDEDKFLTINLMQFNDVENLAKKLKKDQKEWKKISMDKRIELFEHFIGYFKENKDAIGEEISMQMGKPLSQALNEINGLEERTRAFMKLAPKVLKTDVVEESSKFTKLIHKEPVGTVLSLAPWNYPLLTAVNSVVPAILSGNAVLLSHGPRTPLTSTTFKKAVNHSLSKMNLSGMSLLEDFHISYGTLLKLLSSKIPDFVSFTGSTTVGRDVYKAIGTSGRFIDCTLELGGSDGAYVCKENDAKTLDNAIETIVDASFYNAGQSCCAIERAFIHEKHYEAFMKKAVAITNGYKLGNPMDKSTTLGPVARKEHIHFLESLVKDAVAKGAKIECGGKATSITGKGRFFEPTILSNCSSEMKLMKNEIFGPILAVSKIDGKNADDQAIDLINQSEFGLTAAIFTNEKSKMEKFVQKIEVGTVFMNRADYLDPYLPWQGRKDTGKGCSLSEFGFRGFYNLKNAHLKYIA